MEVHKNLAILCSIALVLLTLPILAEIIAQEREQHVQEKTKSRAKPKSVDGSITTEQVSYITTDNFEKEVLESDLPVLVVFTAPWCGPCKILDPVIESLMPEMSDQAKVFKLDTDVSPEISTEFKVTRLPTIIYFNKGEESYRTSSIYARDAYVGYLQGLKEDISIEDTTLQLLDKDWFRRHYLLTEEVEVIEETLKQYPQLLTKKFDNGQSPLSLVLNYPSNTRRELLQLVLEQKPAIHSNDLLGLGRCDEFEKIVENDPDAVNRPDPDGNTPLLTAILGSTLLEHGECVNTILELGAERSLPKTIRNSLGEKIDFQPDRDLVDDLLTLSQKEWGPKWYNDDVGVKWRMLFMEMMEARILKSEYLIAKRAE